MKVRELENRLEEQQQENSDLYGQVNEAYSERDKLIGQLKQCKYEKEKLEQDYVLAQSDIQYYTLEIKNFEHTIVRLTKELEDSASKDDLIEELQSNLQTFDQQIDLQANQIMILQDQLRGPRKANMMV